MKKLFLFLSLFIVSPVLAQNAMPFCTQMSTRVLVKIKTGNPKYITSYSRKDFLRKAKVPYSPHTLGLTVAEFDIDTLMTPQIEQYAGQFCVSLKDVEVTLSYPNLSVYIDKKYPSNSCEYKVIKEHEDYHVSVSQHALTFFKPDVEKVLSRTLASLRPRVVHNKNDIKSATNKMTQTVLDNLQPVIQHINNTMAKKNAAIDTKESYQKTTALCKNW